MTLYKLPFPSAVNTIVRNIPRGTVMTYKEVAVEAGFSGAYRAVGTLMSKNRNKNIPCHRVVRSDGYTGGYAWNPENKIKILREEGFTINDDGKIIFD